MYDPYAEFTRHILPNGLEVHHAYWDRPWIKIGIIIHSGASEDPPDKPGLAHFVEHVINNYLNQKMSLQIFALDCLRKSIGNLKGQVVTIVSLLC